MWGGNEKSPRLGYTIVLGSKECHLVQGILGHWPVGIFQNMAKSGMKGAGRGKRQREAEQAAQEKMTKQLKASAAAVEACRSEVVAT